MCWVSRSALGICKRTGRTGRGCLPAAELGALARYLDSCNATLNRSCAGAMLNPESATALGRRLAQTGLALLLAPIAVAFILVAQLPMLVPWVLVWGALALCVAVLCYRGDAWARWLITIYAIAAVFQSLTAVTTRDAPPWVAVGQFLWSALVVGLLQAPAARAFLRAQYNRRRGGLLPPAV